jgi:hypothetical protein
MYVGLEMSTDNLSQMSTALEEMKISLGLILFLALEDFGSSPNSESMIEVQETTYEVESDKLKANLSILERIRKHWDLVAWFKFFKLVPDPTVFLTELEDEIAILGDGDFEFKTAMTPQNALYRKLLLIAFESKLKTLVKDKFRSYKDILRGFRSPSETVVYKVDKWSVDEDNNPLEDTQYW